MSKTPAETTVSGECPVCAARLFRPSSVEETEMLTCDECRSALVVDRRVDGLMVLGEAPRIEEDWGE
ncbi:MAG TPA: hypothetical protein PLP83_00435 [Candidatus Aminicenantes bacterium]|nr:hypothetical protein [Candidatus Aminicenantes bacterium]